MSEDTAQRQVLVPFAGPGAGTAPLTWGQKAIFKEMRDSGWTLNVSGAQPLEDGTTVDDVAEQLRHFMTKYPALRLRLGTDAGGRPCQVVPGSGEITLDVIDVAGDSDPRKVANDMWYARLLTPLDMHNDGPIRLAVVCHRGQPRYRVWTMSHAVVDGTGFALLMADVGMGDLAGQLAGDPRTVQLLDLGWREQTPQVRRISDRAMTYWESHLHSVPPSTFGEPTHPDGRLGQRYWHGRANSPATYLAMLAIAARTRTDTSHVLLALIATSVARVTGVNPLPAKIIMNNRFRPGLAEAIAPVSQNSVFTVDLADTTVDEVVARARKASFLAAKNAYYDPDQLAELTARLDRERGYPAQVTLRINDRRVHTRRVTEQAARDCRVTLEQIERVRSKGFLIWDGTLENMHAQAFITIDDYDDTVLLQVIFDMGVFTESEVEAMLRGVEEVAIEAAFDPAVPTRITRARVLA